MRRRGAEAPEEVKDVVRRAVARRLEAVAPGVRVRLLRVRRRGRALTGRNVVGAGGSSATFDAQSAFSTGDAKVTANVCASPVLVSATACGDVLRQRSAARGTIA